MKKLGHLFSDVHDFTSEEARQLLHNKFVVVIGDSNYRAIYKDLVYILQTDELLTLSQLKQKDGEFFENDRQVEFNGPHSRNDYRLVHQYRTRHHLVRFYFITRVYSTYMESILNDFRADLEADLVPDVVILNSCLWDLNRYHDDSPTEPPVPKAIREYCENAEKLFQALDNILPSSCLIIWVTALPIRENARGYVIQQPHRPSAKDMIEANLHSHNLANRYSFDVLDLHHRFCCLEALHASDGIHWNSRAHRLMTKLLLTHIAEAWQVELEKRKIGIQRDENAKNQQPSPWRTMPLTHQPFRGTSSSPHSLFNFSSTYGPRNAQYEHMPRRRWGQGYQSAQLSPIQHNGSHISGPNGGVPHEQDLLPYVDLSNPRNYFHTQPCASHDSRPICSSEQEHHSQPNPDYFSHAPDHVGRGSWPICSSEQERCSNYSHVPLHAGYDTSPLSVIEPEHHPQPSPSYSCAPNSIGCDSRSIHFLEEEQCVQSYLGNDSHTLQDGRPTHFAEQEARLQFHPSSSSHVPQDAGYASRPINSAEQEQGLHSFPHDYSPVPLGAGCDSRIIGLPEWALWPPLNPRSDVLVQHDARNGPWSTDGDEDDADFPLHMEGEIHHNGFWLDFFTHRGGRTPDRLPRRGPRGGSRKMPARRLQQAYDRRHASAPYAKNWKSTRNPC
ncbi:uncharacterized protein PHA67_023213 [Liasis olivaceus]